MGWIEALLASAAIVHRHARRATGRRAVYRRVRERVSIVPQMRLPHRCSARRAQIDNRDSDVGMRERGHASGRPGKSGLTSDDPGCRHA